jgi:hypothetical protein
MKVAVLRFFGTYWRSRVCIPFLIIRGWQLRDRHWTTWSISMCSAIDRRGRDVVHGYWSVSLNEMGVPMGS